MNWPLSDQHIHFDLGQVFNSVIVEAIDPHPAGTLGTHHAGLWECDLTDEALTWSAGVYDIFGLERRAQITREQAVAHYTEDSRAKLERLRSYAIHNGVGFTLDVEIRAAAVGKQRRIRLIGAPVCDGGRTVRLHGLKIAL